MLIKSSIQDQAPASGPILPFTIDRQVLRNECLTSQVSTPESNLSLISDEDNVCEYSPLQPSN